MFNSKSILIALGLAVLSSTPVSALTRSDADHTGYKIAQKSCQSIWDGRAKTQIKAFELGIMSLEDPTVINRFNQLNNIANQYGTNHQLFKAMVAGYFDVLLDTCRQEYLNLPEE